MPLYELTEAQNRNVINWLKSITISADFNGREKFNTELKHILNALNRPIQPAGKPTNAQNYSERLESE